MEISEKQLKKRNHYNFQNNEISNFLIKNKNKGLFTSNTGYTEKKLLSSMCLKVRAFWNKENNTYPFSFKQKKLLINKEGKLPILLIERQQFNFKRVNPNQFLLKNK